MKRIFFVIVALLIPLGLFAQPEVEWVWTDSEPCHQVNSITTTADSGVLVMSNCRVVKLSADGVEEWRTEIGATSACLLEEQRYVVSRWRTLYFLSEDGVLQDSLRLDDPPSDCENGFLGVLNVGTQAKAVIHTTCDDYDHWGEPAGGYAFVSQYNILPDATISWGSSLGDFYYSDYVSGFDAKLLSNGRAVYLTGLGEDPYKLFSTGSPVWHRDAESSSSHTWYDPKLLVNDESEFFVVSSRRNYGNDSTSVFVEKYGTNGVRVWTRDLLIQENLQYGILAVTPQTDSLNLMVLASSRYYGPDDSLVFVLFDNFANIRGTWAVAYGAPTYQLKASVGEDNKVFVARRIDSDTVSYMQVTAYSLNWAVTEPPNIAAPSSFALHPNFPNPFNPLTEISFDMPYAALATLKVYDVLGREVATLVNGMHEAGTHRVTFDGTGLSSGVYIYRLESGGYSNGGFSQSRKMVLMK